MDPIKELEDVALKITSGYGTSGNTQKKDLWNAIEKVKKQNEYNNLILKEHKVQLNTEEQLLELLKVQSNLSPSDFKEMFNDESGRLFTVFANQGWNLLDFIFNKINGRSREKMIEKIALKLISNASVSCKWISVKDSLPDEMQWVLACDSEFIVRWSRRLNNVEWQIGNFSIEDIVYWMPIPKIPNVLKTKDNG